MELTPEVKEQLEAQKAQCPFCKIIKGEIEGKKVYSDDEIHAVLDINPGLDGHTLIMPKEHYPILPYLPTQTFKRLFGLLPQFAKAKKEGLLKTGVNVFVANGAAAGQQSPHFLIHLFGREDGDKFSQLDLDDSKQIDTAKHGEAEKLLANNLPIMMRNHFGRVPNNWHKGVGERPGHLKDATGVIYEDEKTLVVMSSKPQATGHLEIISKEEQHDLENLSYESSSHLFYVASFAATGLFEGLGAHGTNIVAQSGPNGLALHVLPRYQEDGLDLQWKPKSDKGNLDDYASRISDALMVEIPKEPEKPKPKELSVDTGNNVLDEINLAIQGLY